MLRATDSFAKSDTGRQRRSNEDREFERAPLFAVADGMGGARAGEVASKIVVETLAEGLPETGSDEERLAAAVREANARIHDLARAEPDRAGMGTTVTAAYVGDDGVAVAHVGDSRAYRLRDGELERLTHDHSLVAELVRRGKLTEEEAEEHPQKSVITRALGPEAAVDVDRCTFPARDGDLFLLCSDGLTGMVPEDRIAEILAGADSLRAAAQALIREANERGGRDNITVVLFRVEEVGAAVVGDDRPTEIGLAAPTPEQVRVARAAAQARDAGAVAAPPRRTAPLPPREESARPPARRERRRIKGLRPALATLAVLALVAGGVWVGTRAVYFVGVDERGFVAIYQGLPYEGPGGLDLFSRSYVSGVPAADVPPRRRAALLDHKLRSQQDAADLVRKLELGQVAE
ncbi:MAG TPA: Stp1/IreP family PP2C-type Ser/Thr phosphatase [Solirubrobacteraceae bacterium]|nr:Stp1/IreP family PP2C-type Ser/Thr phosphatase [Solirubrobacteraceae bacterium]